MAESKYPPVAVVGVSALFPGSISTTGFWKNILEGHDLLSPVPESHWLIEDYYDPDPMTPDKIYANRGGFLPHVDFSPMEFGVPPNIVPATDTAQLLALGVAKQVLEDAAQGDFSEMDRDRISVIMGVASATELVGHMSSRLQQPVWERALRTAGLAEDEVQRLSKRILDSYVPWQESTFPGLLGNVVAGRIANRLDLGGTNCVVDAACASSLAALEIGINELYLGQSDLVITGGVDTLNDILMFMCFSKTTALSVSGDCRPFSDKADGTMLGEGIGMFAFKRLEDAERDGDQIYAVLKGLGTSSDGRAKSIYAPVSKGQAKALRRAYDYAGYGPETVELVEAHGTGTKAGDAAEFGSLRIVFDDVEREDKQWCALGSVKSQIGHAKAAAGAGGLFKVIMALHHKVLPPTIKVDRPNPALDIEQSAFYLNTEAKPWIRDDKHPRRASVSSFGFGGTNFHVTLEEYTGPGKAAARGRAFPTELFAFSAQDANSVLEQARAIADGIEDEESYAFAAYSSLSSFSTSHNNRLLIVAQDGNDLRDKIERAAKVIGKSPQTSFSNPQGIEYGAGEAVSGKVAFLFPGQGSQYVNMGADLSIHLDSMRQSWDRVATLDDSGDDVSLHRVVYPTPVFDQASRDAQHAFLTETQRAQPAIGAVSLGMKRWLDQVGIKADMVAGHSYGEVSALWAAGVFDDESFLKVSRKRGQLMAEASKLPGAMSAVVTDLATLEPLLGQWNLDVVIANHNSPTQIVMSGSVSGIEALEGKLTEANITFKRLNVSTAFHSPIVSDSVKPFSEFLKGIEFNDSTIPVYANSQAAQYESGSKSKRKTLAGQIASRVRFVEQTQALYEDGARIFIEVGPGHVLTNLTKRCLPSDADCVLVSLDQKKQHGVTALLKAMAKLAAAGQSFDLAALWEGYRAPVDPATRKKSPFVISLNGANHGKPHPRELDKLPPLFDKPLGSNAKPTTSSKAPASVAKPVASKPAPKPSAPVARRPSAPTPKPAKPVMTQKKTPQPPVATPTAPMTHVTTTAPVQDASWMDAFQRLQEQTASTHQAYQQLMAQNHQAFLQMAQSSFESLMQNGGVPIQQTQSTQPVQQAPQYQTPAAPVQVAPIAAPRPVQPAPVSAPKPAPQVAKPAAKPAVAKPAPKPAAPKAVAKPVQKPTPTAPVADNSADLQKIMLEVVSEKTGYPIEMLDMNMELEADLGIDSIKRVEILSSMQERVPSLPEVDTNAMASLVTVLEIVDYMKSLGAGGAAPTASAPATPQAPASAPAPAAGGVDLMPIMLEVVSEKTGYPSEMLDMSMELEADLGIDSIKRVEILSSMQERVPSLPEVDTNTMASLVTVKEIVDYMQSLTGAPAPSAQAAPQAAASSTPAPSSAPAIDLLPVMLEVVSEKTGYPSEMLDMSMELEADLGIDSIKRVEILSSMQERVPSLPEVDTNTMASLVTVQEIVDYMQSLLGDAPTAQASTTPEANTTAPSNEGAADLMPIMLEVVSEKTGYPTEMLDMSMELEADLGIDSIKRVEILSSMQERVPSLPEVDTNTMASLVTLQEIVDYMQGLLGKPQALQASRPEAPEAQAIDSSAHKEMLLGVMLDVVAEKTGYPTEMLDMSMELEADLGIDSIKRVEILSSMQERVPSLPEVDTNTMASLVTLEEIVDYMSGLATGQALSTSSTSSSVAPTVQTVTNTTARAATSTSYETARYTVALADSPETGFVLEGMAAVVNLEVVDNPNGIGQHLVDVLNQSGWAATLVDHGTGQADGVIYLGGLRPDGNVEEEWAIQQDAFSLASQYASTLEHSRGVFVTVQDTGGDFGLSGAGQRAWRGGLPGLVKTLNQEWSFISAKAIDLDTSALNAEQVAHAIYRELIAGGPEVEVAIDAYGQRRTLVGTPTTVTGDAMSYDNSDVIVVSGGARGVTAHSIIEFARQSHANFVLLGRSEIQEEAPEFYGITAESDLKRTAMEVARNSGEKVTPKLVNQMVRRILAGREITQTLTSIEEAGGQAQYVAVDVRNTEALGQTLDDIRAQWGPITGVVHGAGVLADALLTKKTLDQYQRVFLTKVDGLRTLLTVTANDPLKMICMFSSVAARSGNVGQCDYAMANETLNKVALAEQARRGNSCVVKSLGWGPWDAGMVTPALKAMFEERGIKLIGLDDGAHAFSAEMQHRSGECELVLGGAVSEQGLYAPVPEQGVEMRVFVHEQNQPYLLSHEIQGQVVLPVVLVMEWFARMATALWPDQTVVACEEMRVLRGVQLDQFQGEGHWLRLVARLDATQSNALSLQLLDDQDHPRFSARVIMGQTIVEVEDFNGVTSALGQAPWSTTPEMYAPETLFHGPDFQVIESMDSFGDDGVIATLTGEKSDQWAGGPWMTNPALLDGALQLALLYGLKAVGGQSLPLGLGRYTRYQGSVEGNVRCELAAVKVSKQKTVTDVRLVDDQGHLVADLRGVEMFVVPGGTAQG